MKGDTGEKFLHLKRFSATASPHSVLVSIKTVKILIWSIVKVILSHSLDHDLESLKRLSFSKHSFHIKLPKGKDPLGTIVRNSVERFSFPTPILRARNTRLTDSMLRDSFMESVCRGSRILRLGSLRMQRFWATDGKRTPGRWSLPDFQTNRLY